MTDLSDIIACAPADVAAPDAQTKTARFWRAVPFPPERAELRGLLEDLVFLSFFHQQRGRIETLTVTLGQLFRTGHELAQTVLVDVLHHTASPGRVTDPHDGTDVGVSHLLDNAFLHAAHGFQCLHEQETLLHVFERNLLGT